MSTAVVPISCATLVLYRIWLGAVSERQPVAQLVRCFVWRRPVEGHQRRWAAGKVNEVGAPSVRIDRAHLDQVFVPVDDFFEAMNHSADGCGVMRNDRQPTT